MRANTGGITVLGGRTCPTKVPGEGTNPCIRSFFATKNVFDVVQDLSESIRGSPGPQLNAADGLLEPITHDLHQSLIELLERPEILSPHAMRRVGRGRPDLGKEILLKGTFYEAQMDWDIIVGYNFIEGIEGQAEAEVW